MSKAERPKVLNLGRIGDARLDLIPPLAGMEPGMEALEFNVIIAPGLIGEKVGSVFISDDAQERLELAMQLGRIINVSPLAFNYDNWPEGSTPPKPGDVVWFARYAGGEFTGADGHTYRLVKDKDVGARITVAIPEPAQEMLDRLAEQRAKATAPPAAAVSGNLGPMIERRLKSGPGLDRVRQFSGGKETADAAS